jgi:hypothetical protein
MKRTQYLPMKEINNMKKTYLINGWEESKSYFMSFGFTQKEIDRMENGEEIRRIDSVSDNTFAIKVKEN